MQGADPLTKAQEIQQMYLLATSPSAADAAVQNLSPDPFNTSSSDPSAVSANLPAIQNIYTALASHCRARDGRHHGTTHDETNPGSFRNVRFPCRPGRHWQTPLTRSPFRAPEPGGYWREDPRWPTCAAMTRCSTIRRVTPCVTPGHIVMTRQPAY